MSEPQTDKISMTMRPILSAEDFGRPWGSIDLLTLPGADADPYLIGFAHSDVSVERALRLRYEVFNLEMNEGLAASEATGLDRDEYDAQMTHLILIARETNLVVGTYRIQTVEHAMKHLGLYSAIEYDMSGLTPYFDTSIELGRACLAMEHRSMRAIISLWQGIGAYLNLFGLHHMFGCCSLTTTDPDDGWRALKTLRTQDVLHESVVLPALAGNSCGESSRETDPDLGEALALPKLFRTYLRLGAKVVSEPAIDHDFGTVDFLILLDARIVTFSQLDIIK